MLKSVHVLHVYYLFGTTNDSRVANFVGAFASTTNTESSQFSNSDQWDFGIHSDT